LLEIESFDYCMSVQALIQRPVCVHACDLALLEAKINGMYLYSTFLVNLTTQSAFTLHVTFIYSLTQHATQGFLFSLSTHIHTQMDASVVGNMGCSVLPKDTYLQGHW